MSKKRPAEDLEDLYETAPCGYISLSPSGEIVRANRTIADWLGWQSQELVGRSIHEILSFGGRIAFETHLAPLLRMQAHVHEIALDLLTSAGDKIPTIANAAEKRDGEGSHVFTRLTLFKAVDRRTYERSLLEARIKAEADAKLQAESAIVRERFIAVLGHDLRNPLAAIDAGIRILQRREEMSDQSRTVISDMARSIARASSLIDDVLDLARGSLGNGLVINPDKDEPLTPVLKQVVAEIRAIEPARAIDVRLEIEEPLYCDRSRLGQLASNLLANAVTHGSSSHPIRFHAKTEGDQFILLVANAGEPITEQERARLFQPFFRGAARSSRNGLGLGLFIASEIAKAHDGTIEVSSDDEETSFVLKMPWKTAEPQESGDRP